MNESLSTKYILLGSPLEDIKELKSEVIKLRNLNKNLHKNKDSEYDGEDIDSVDNDSDSDYDK